MQDFSARTRILIGDKGIKMLQNSSVAVIGLGGVGSYAAESIARSGVGQITIVDHDRIEKSNLNRQIPALNSTIGKYKTEAVAKRLKDINPEISLNEFTCRYDQTTSCDILNMKHDYVIDAIDSLPNKVHLIKSCLQKDIPIVSSMGTANRINPLLLHLADLKNTSVCPIARKLRRELRQTGINKGVMVVYSTEIPIKPEKGGNHLGSLPFVPAAAGLLLANYVIRSILDI